MAKSGPKPRPVEERFWEKVDKTEGCWLWTSMRNDAGYGLFGVGSRTDSSMRHVRAHRFAYELLVGPIPEGLQLDHLCRIRHCVNPTHLEPVTNRENLLRGETRSAAYAKRTHCDYGHPFAGENLRFAQGARRCRECDRQRNRRSWQRKRRR